MPYYGCNGWRRIGVWFWRGSLRNGYHIQGRQQACKLPNPDTEVVTKNNNTELFKSCYWNEYNLNLLTRHNCTESLVPAAAVIPAPIAYTKVVAVKKLPVGFWGSAVDQLQGMLLDTLFFFTKTTCALKWVWVGFATFSLKKSDCSKQACA